MARQLHPKRAEGNILGLDIGGVRIGVAVANTAAKLPRPLAVVPNNDKVFQSISKLVESEGVDQVIIGLPRNLSGLETAQSQKSRDFGKKLKEFTDRPIVFADETLSSVRAQQYKAASKKSKHSEDSLAACFILEEYFATLYRS